VRRSFCRPRDRYASILLRELVQIDLEFRQLRGRVVPNRRLFGKFPELQGISIFKSDPATVATLTKWRNQRPVCHFCWYTVRRPIPEKFGRLHHLERNWGKGRLGAGVPGQDTQLDRQVALKIPSSRESNAAALLDRFRRERDSVATLRHPNLCPVFDVGRNPGTAFHHDGLYRRSPASRLCPRQEAATGAASGGRGCERSPWEWQKPMLML